MSKVAKWIFPAAGGKDGIIGTVKAAVGFITGNGSLIAAGIAQVAGLGKRKDAGQDRQASVTNMSVGEVPREALLGRVCTGGSLVDAFNHSGQYGTDKVTRCIALCDHAVDAIEGFFVGDVYYAWTGNGAQSAFSNKLTLEFRNATTTGYAPPSYAVSGGGWTATDRLCSVTHIWVTTDIDDKVWPQGHPQFRWVLRGLKVFDPRFDPALGYAGPSPQTWDNRASHTFSENAELLRYAYNRGIYAEGHHGDPAYLLIGRGLTAEEAPPSRVIAAANLCAEVVSGKMRYAASAVVRAADEFIQVEEMFAAAMAGDIVQREGGIQVEPGQAKSPIYTITDADLVLGEPVSFSRFLPDGSEGRRNTVVPSYVEPSQGWKDHAGPVRRSIDDILADGGPRELPLSLPFVNDGAQADRNAEIARRLSRLERRAAIVLPPDFSPLEEGDVIAWQSARRHGGATVRYRIDRWVQDEKWRMRLTLREIASSVYGVPDPVSDASDPPPAPPVIDALALSGVSGIAIQLGAGSELPGLRVAWATPDPAVRAILVEVREEGGGVAAPTRIDDVAALTKDVTNGVRAGTDLEFRLTPITDPTRAVTPTAWLPVTAGDIVIAPGGALPTVPGMPVISLGTVIAPDGTELSTLSGSWTAVATASAYDIEIDDGVAAWIDSTPTASIKNYRVTAGRSYRYRVKAVNRDGVRSAAWSAWSASVAAGGDVTPPGNASGFNITNLARRIVLDWANPTDDDYAGLQIYRNATGTAPSGATTPTFGNSSPITGTIFTDANVTAQVSYYYWCRTTDRSGNVGSYVYMGSGYAGFVSVGGGDVRSDDMVLVTEYGTAALIQDQAPTATSSDFAVITGATRPSDNAGTSGTLTAIGSYSTVVGNTVYKDLPGTHGINQGGAVGVAQKGSCFISSSIHEGTTGGGWQTHLALDGDATSFTGDTQDYWAIYYANGAGTGVVRIYTNNATILAAEGYPTGVNANSRMTIAYDGASVFVIVDGVRLASTPAPAGLRLWPKALSFFNDRQYLGLAGSQRDIQHGAWSENTSQSAVFVPLDQHCTMQGNATVPDGSVGWDTGGVYTRNTLKGSAYVSARPKTAGTFQQFGLAATEYVATPPTSHYDQISYGWYLFGTDYAELWAGGVGLLGVFGCSIDDVFAVEYDGAWVRWFRNGIEKGSQVAAPNLNMRAHFAHSSMFPSAGFRDIQFTTAREAARIDAIWNPARTAQYGAAQLVTADGTAALIVNQADWATHTALTPSIVTGRTQYLNTAGRIVDGRGLPLNVASGRGISFSPSYVFSVPLSFTDTTIEVVASTVTLVGGVTLSLPAATITGLTASTAYSVFRDLQTSTYVAVSGSAASYRTSADRYLYLGIQSTTDAGGLFVPPPPPPPGSGDQVELG